MTSNYYVLLNNEQHGPFSIADIRRLKFQRDTKIWVNGLEDWISVSNFEDVCAKVDTARTEQAALTERLQRSTTTSATKQASVTGFQPDGITTNGYMVASLGSRVAACLLHWVIGFLFLGFFDKYIPIWLYLWVIPLAAAVSYHFWSGNIGHKILKLKVIKKDTGEDFRNPVLGFMRETAKLFLAWFILPVVWLFFDKEKQNSYDKIFNTVVVQNTKIDGYDYI